MKRSFFITLCLVLVLLMGFATTAHARGRGRGWVQQESWCLFNEDGQRINWRGDFTNDGDRWAFGRYCWFVDADGNVVNAFGTIIYDADGNPVDWQRRHDNRWANYWCWDGYGGRHGWGNGRNQAHCRRW